MKFLLPLAVICSVGIGTSTMAGERLTDRQMDMVTAAGVVADARARAAAQIAAGKAYVEAAKAAGRAIIEAAKNAPVTSSLVSYAAN